jgi:hypothetical protein
MGQDDRVHVYILGTVHALSSDFESLAVCGAQLPNEQRDYEVNAMTLEPIDCLLCLAEPKVDIYFRCACSWVGSDPDYWKGKHTCPACLHIDKKRVVVTAVVS